MSDNAELPPEAERILKDAEKRAKAEKKHEPPPELTSEEQKATDDWLAALAKEALAARAAEKELAPPPDEKALVEALAAKDHTEYDRVRRPVAKKLGIRVGTLD